MNARAPTADIGALKTALRFGRCELRPDTRELLVDGCPQPVRRMVFDLIVYLVDQRPRAVPHAEALRMVWQRADVSPKMLARAVMEARRACEDTPEDPKIIVSVHGVGYRFAGTLAGASPPPLEDGPGELSTLIELRELLDQGAEALDAGQVAEARTLAERALASAVQVQSQSERVRALVLCSAVTMRDGTAANAARLAAQAWQIARGEGQPQLVAQARVAVGYVHLAAGDRVLAIQHFEASRHALEAPGYESDLARCLHFLSMAFRDTDKPETGLKLCRRALALRRACRQSANKINTDRVNEVMFLLNIGDAELEKGLASKARENFEQALALSDSLLTDLQAHGGGPQLQSMLGNRAFALERLGRMDEAWQAFSALQQAMQPVTDVASPIASERQRVMAMLRATLLAGSGRHDEALAELAHLTAAGTEGPAARLLPRLYGTASSIARRAGRLQEALDWAGRQLAVQRALQSDEAASLARILEAELGAADLEAALEQARAQIVKLTQDNEDLRRQVNLAAGLVPIDLVTGLAGRQHMAHLFAAPHRHARMRGLPMCLGMLTLVNLPALRAAHPLQMVQEVLRRACELLTALADVTQPVVDMDDGQLLFHVREAGLARASEVCEVLLAGLRRQDWPLFSQDLTPRWHCQAMDAGRHASLEACVQSLATSGVKDGGFKAEAAPPLQ